MNTQKRTWIVLYSLIWLLVLILGLPSNARAQTSGDVAAVAWSLDGTRIVGGGTNGLLRVWNTAGQTLLTFNEVSGNVYSVDWSPDSTKIVSGHEDGNARVWNATTGQLIATLTGHDDSVTSVDWSPNGSRIVTGSFYEIDNLRVWDATTYQVTAIDQTGSIFEVAWSPDSNKILTAFDSGFVNIQDVNLNDPVGPNEVSDAHLTARWSPTGTEIASGDGDGQIHIWNTSTYASVATLSGHTDRVDAIAYRPNGENLASASNDGTIRIWYLPTGETVKTFPKPTIFTTSIAWSPEGRRLAYGGTNGTVNIITVFDGGTGLRGQYFDNSDLTVLKYFLINPTISFSWSTGSPSSAIGANTFSVRWTGKVEPLYSETYAFTMMYDDGARLWVDDQLIINDWNIHAGRTTSSGNIALSAGVKYDIKVEYFENTDLSLVNLSWQSPSQTVQTIPASQLYPPEGQLAFTGTTSGNDEVYRVNPDGSGEINLSNHAASDEMAAWSPDGTKLAFVSERDGNKEIYMMNADGTGLRRLTNHTATDQHVAWSPDGTQIAFRSSRTGNSDIYKLSVTGTGIPTATRLTTHADAESNPMWLPNGLKIIYERNFGGSNPEIYMMNPDGTGVTRLTNRAGYDVSPFVSPDGSKIAVRANYGAAGDEIVIITISPLSVVRVTNNNASDHFQSWSSDSSKIVFLSTRDGNSEVYSMNADGSNQTRLTNSAEAESYAVWSADSRQIAFIRSNDVWLMNADGSNQHNFTNTPSRVEREIVWWQAKQTY